MTDSVIVRLFVLKRRCAVFSAPNTALFRGFNFGAGDSWRMPQCIALAYSSVSAVGRAANKHFGTLRRKASCLGLARMEKLGFNLGARDCKYYLYTRRNSRDCSQGT